MRPAFPCGGNLRWSTRVPDAGSPLWPPMRAASWRRKDAGSGGARPSEAFTASGDRGPMMLAEVQCAFCRGKGKDPFDVMYEGSTCCICGGRGTNRVKEPNARCAFCGASGVYPRSRLTCTACGGVGVDPVAGQTEPCPNCLGNGVEPTSGAGLYCLTCHGAGVVLQSK